MTGSRRDFIKAGVAVAAGAGLTACADAEKPAGLPRQVGSFERDVRDPSLVVVARFPTDRRDCFWGVPLCSLHHLEAVVPVHARRPGDALVPVFEVRGHVEN